MCTEQWSNFQLTVDLLFIIFYLNVSLRTNRILYDTKKHFILIIIYQSQSIKTINFQIYFIYSIKWGWLGPIFGIFLDLLTHCNHSTTWHPEYMTLCPHSLDYKKTWPLINHASNFFSLQTWVAISEMGRLGPILDLKLISFFSFFTAT